MPNAEGRMEERNEARDMMYGVTLRHNAESDTIEVSAGDWCIGVDRSELEEWVGATAARAEAEKVTQEREFHRDALIACAQAAGIESSIELIARAESDQETYADILARTIAERMAALAAARADVAAVEAACFEVCRDNTRETLGDDVDPDMGRFACMNEDGDPIIEADTPAEVVRQMAACWTALGERYDRLAAALAAARAENERMRAENVAADGTARAAVELVQDCREVLGLDRGASLTAAVMRAAKDARRYHALRVFLRPELFDRRWQVTADAEDLLNALAATYSFDAREDVNIDAAIDTLAAQEGSNAD